MKKKIFCFATSWEVGSAGIIFIVVDYRYSYIRLLTVCKFSILVKLDYLQFVSFLSKI